MNFFGTSSRASKVTKQIIVAIAVTGSASAESAWKEQTFTDEMRNTSIFTTSTKSLNTARLSFPYSGGTTVQIVLRKDSNSKTSALLLVSRGQMLCDPDSCALDAKFDDNDVEEIHAFRPDGAPAGLFMIHRGDLLIEKIKASKRVTLELNFFDHGSEQFKFDVRGLKGL